MAIVPGRHIGNFQIVRLIGEGGFGEVYEAEHPLLDRRVAIKVLHGGLIQDAELVRRFLNEARAASGIHHPNIVEVFDAGISAESEPYIVMEYLDGNPLQKLIADQGRLRLRVVQEIARQACSALAAAHAAGIVHRDLKPENLFVLQNPASPLGLQVKVLDFGIAKIKHTGEHDPTMRTRTGLVMGSPAYMSPEQCKDSSDVDHRTDIYSMGVITYEMLAGAPPFACESAAELLLMQMSSPPSALRLRLPDVPDHVEEAVMRALAKDRAARYDRIDHFVGALLGPHPAHTLQGRPPVLEAAPPAAEPRGREGQRAPDAPSQPATVVLDSSAEPSAGSASPKAPAKNVTTFAHATGEATAPAPHREPRAQQGSAPHRRRSLVLGGGAAVILLASVLGVFLLKRSAEPPRTPPAPAEPVAATSPAAPPAVSTIRLRVQSAPPGAMVIDTRDGSTLGQTPLVKLVPRSTGSISLKLRRDGYKEETVALALDADASALINLQPAPAPADDRTEPAGDRATARRSPTTPRRPGKETAPPPPPPDDQWLAH